MKTLIIDNYDSFTYNLYQYVAELGGNPVVVRNDEVTLAEIEHGGYSHIIISPGPGSPENLRDFGVCSEVIKKCTTTPVLGVCLGHQGIIHALGGKIVRAPLPMHGKQSTIVVAPDSVLFAGLPKKIEAMRYHSLIGLRESIPPELRVTAMTDDDEQLVMAVEHTARPLFGIQFHPESIGTPQGKQILKNFLTYKAKTVAQQEPSMVDEIAEAIIDGTMDPEASEMILKKMAQRGETVEEIVAFAQALQKRAVYLPLPSTISAVMDICGTGGSGLPRMNISTVAAFVLAASGVTIAKHGNRGQSGRCGSFDLLEALGLPIDLDSTIVTQTLSQLNLGFIYAPLYHPALKKLTALRKQIGTRTIFNLVGPLVNPARPSLQLLGTTSLATAEKIVAALKMLGATRACVVAGSDGLDDITLTGPTDIFELEAGHIRRTICTPNQLGLKQVPFTEISGGDSSQNMQRALELLNGKAPEAHQNLLILNCAFALKVAGSVKTVDEGIEEARTVINSGAAFARFEKYKQLTLNLTSTHHA